MTEQTSDDQRSKCRFCGAETVGSDVCHKCYGNEARQDFFEKVAESRLGEVKEKVWPTYAMFCDDQDLENPTGFKPARVAQWLAENEQFKTDRKSDVLYYGDQNTGCWSKNGETKLKEIVTKILGEYDRQSHFQNILHTLKALTYTDVIFSEKIAVQNGLLNVETAELTPFSLKEMAFYQIDTTYNKEAVSEHWLEFLKQVLPEEDIPTFQELSGYLLLPDYRFHKIFYLFGDGRNGKGVWQRTMEAILGESNVSSLGLEEFDGNHRFAMERLYGKLFNPCSEPTTNRILQTALLKKATGQDTIEAEIKGKQARIKFRNTAKIVVIANRFPKVRDSTTAFKERMIFITFPNQFTGKNCIPNLEQIWLSDPIERMGILNWMLQGLQRLLANGCFTESKTQEETEIQFHRASDSIAAFLSEIVIFDKNLVSTRAETFSTYKLYCDFYGLDQESDKKFTQRLKETPRVSVTTVSKPKRERAWQGIGLKTLNDDGTVTDVTDLGRFTLAQISEDKIEKSINTQKSVTGVTSATEVKNCGQCAWFRSPKCESEAWETRNGNAEPLTNWCFKPRNYEEAS